MAFNRMLSLVRRMNFVFTLVLAALATPGILHGQKGAEKTPLSEAIANLRKGAISDGNLAQLDAIAQSDSPQGGPCASNSLLIGFSGGIIEASGRWFRSCLHARAVVWNRWIGPTRGFWSES
jgi:hypothetical protein